MKRQIKLSIKAHLPRSALILLLLLAICAIPFALAQSGSRGTNNRSVVNHAGQSRLPTKIVGPLRIPAFQILPVPIVPAAVLYDQLNNPGSAATSSQEAPDAPAFSDLTADDFVVPAGEIWSVTEVDAAGTYGNGPGPADNFNVFFYQNIGTLPGPQVYSATAQPYVNNSGVFQVTLTAPAVLGPGRYWVSVQAHMNFTSNGQWFWVERTGRANSAAAWENPGGGQPPPDSCPAPGCPTPCPLCQTWSIRQCCVGSPPGEPDQMFRLIGTIVGATPTPTATGAPSPTATATPTPTATITPSPTATATGTPSASATPTPSATGTPTPAPGACTSYEAESATLAGGAVVLNCPTCSNGQEVGFVGSNSGTLEFNVSAATSGNYSVTICYLNGDAVRYALLSVNGGAGSPVSFPSTGSFQIVGSIQRTVTLNAGNNTLKFDNPIVGNWAPDFDRIQFNCPTCAAATLGNLSTRSFVQTGDDVMIGGFIVRGGGLKRVIIRAIGPELSQYGIPDPLQNPTLELHDGTGALIASNNDWQHTIIGGIITSDQVQQILNTGHAPGDPNESAIVANLLPGNYTATVRGVNSTMGVALVEVYDLNQFSGSFLSNVSTRSFVQTGDNVMIGGFIVQGTQSRRIIVRAIGPELGQYGVPDPLHDPTLELHDGSGALIASNNNWQHTMIGGIITQNQVQDIQNSGHAPADASESAIIATLPPGNYTAIVRGVNNTTGVALVEAYDLD